MEDDAPLWWDDASYAAYQAFTGDEPLEASSAPDVEPWEYAVASYDEPPF